MTRAHISCLVLITFLWLTGCGGSLRSQQPSERFTTGFWVWRSDGAAPAGPEGLALDALYFQGGEIDQEPYIKQPSVYVSIPDNLPAAGEYWVTIRFDHQAVPGAAAIPLLLQQIPKVRAVAAQRRLNLAGIQLDIDSPTGSLGQYAAFLADLRKGLPPGFGLSITALLDWFRDGTQISQVVQQVDEFVPQFYDAAIFKLSGARDSVAAPLDSTKWGPVFNRFGKRFRIGLSSFGRASSGQYINFSDLAPMDVASIPAFALKTGENAAGELVLTYRATRETNIGYSHYTTGQTIQFILPTAETIHASVQAARGIGGNCTGVLFFRWPVSGEVLAMDPSDVLAAAGVEPPRPKPPPSVELVDGGCATASCADVYFLNAPSLSATPFRYRIHASAALDYFLPGQRIPVRMSGPSDLELSLPRYGGRPRFMLGRVVSKTPVKFTVQTLP